MLPNSTVTSSGRYGYCQWPSDSSICRRWVVDLHKERRRIGRLNKSDRRRIAVMLSTINPAWFSAQFNVIAPGQNSEPTSWQQTSGYWIRVLSRPSDMHGPGFKAHPQNGEEHPFLRGSFPKLWKLYSHVYPYFGNGSPLYHRDVVKLDRQDDNAATRLFSAKTLKFLASHHPDCIGVIVYLFVFGELVDAYQNRHITHSEWIKLVLRARFFLDSWEAYLSTCGYRKDRYFISREASDIIRIITEGFYCARHYSPWPRLEAHPILWDPMIVKEKCKYICNSTHENEACSIAVHKEKDQNKQALDKGFRFGWRQPEGVFELWSTEVN